MSANEKPSLLLQIPRELRDLIYEYLVDYPEMKPLIDKNVEHARASFASRFGPDVSLERIQDLLPWTDIVQPQPLPMSTPSILLLNRQIYSEALQILTSRTFHLQTPIPANFRRDVRDIFLSDFIGEETLSNVRLVSLRLSFQTMKDANNWYKTIHQLENIWRNKNKIQSLLVHVEPMSSLDGELSDYAYAKRIRKHTLGNVSTTAVTFNSYGN